MKTSTRAVLTATGSAAMLLLGQSAHANNLVASIVGAYDAGCNSCGLENGTTLTNYANNAVGGGDTPSLFFLNPTSHSFTNVTITLTGYQDAAGNNSNQSGTTFIPGVSTASTETLSLPNIAANTVYQLAWAGNITVSSGPTGLNLFNTDYDDELGNPATPGDFRSPTSLDGSGDYCGEPGSGAPTSICGFVGNFSVDFEAMWNGGAISSVFSNYAVITNAFVGWEGLDPDGLSETKYDNHGGTFPGTLADIFTGSHVTGGGTVPEPGSLALLGASLGALGMIRRRRKARPGA